MRFRALASMISTANDYSLLKWPLLANSVLITFLAFMLLMCFQSSSWFTFETYDMRLVKSNKSIVEYPNSYEYSAFGLWSICTEKYSDMTVKCTTWIRQTRPQYFDVILILVSCAVLLANFAIFPSWALTILILYNIKNIYIRHIVVFLWIVFIFLLFITVLNISSLVLVGLTQYYSPGQFVTPTKYISFHNGSGLSYLVWGTIISIICLLLLIASLVWKKYIEMKLIEDEKELYRQLNDDNYTPGWNKIVMIPRTKISSANDHFGEPPPYNPIY